MADVLTYLKGLSPNGSYGWSGESVGQIQDILKAIGVELVGEAIKVKHVPDREILRQCFMLGTQIAEKMRGFAKWFGILNLTMKGALSDAKICMWHLRLYL